MIVKPVKRSLVPAYFLLRAYLASLKLGGRKPVLLDALGVSESKLRDPLRRFDADTVTALCRAADAEIGSSNIYQDLAAAMLPTCFSDAGFSAFFESTFDDALRASLIAQDMGSHKLPYSFSAGDGGSNLIWHEIGGTAELVHLVFANIVQISEALGGDGGRLIKAAYFTHQCPHASADGFGIAGNPDFVPCFYEQDSNRLEFHAETMRSQNLGANHLVAHSASQRRTGFDHGDGKDVKLSKLCYNYLTYLLDKPGLSLDATAETFSMAERTLRRKLVLEGSSFRQILEQVRRDACQLYFLEGTRSLSEIAAKLGYSELSAFTRAYTAWYGHPPSRDFAIHSAMAA